MTFKDALGREIREGDKAAQVIKGNYSTSYEEVTIVSIKLDGVLPIKVKKSNGSLVFMKRSDHLIVLRSDNTKKHVITEKYTITEKKSELITETELIEALGK